MTDTPITQEMLDAAWTAVRVLPFEIKTLRAQLRAMEGEHRAALDITKRAHAQVNESRAGERI